MTKSRARLVLALVVLVASLALLLWGLLPNQRIIRRQLIQPTEMQLPTPGSYLPLPFPWPGRI